MGNDIRDDCWVLWLNYLMTSCIPSKVFMQLYLNSFFNSGANIFSILLQTTVVGNNFPVRVNYRSPRTFSIFVAIHPKSGYSFTGLELVSLSNFGAFLYMDVLPNTVLIQNHFLK